MWLAPYLSIYQLFSTFITFTIIGKMRGLELYTKCLPYQSKIWYNHTSRMLASKSQLIKGHVQAWADISSVKSTKRDISFSTDDKATIRPIHTYKSVPPSASIFLSKHTNIRCQNRQWAQLNIDGTELVFFANILKVHKNYLPSNIKMYMGQGLRKDCFSRFKYLFCG